MSDRSADPALAYRAAEEAERYKSHHAGSPGRRLRSLLEARFCAKVLDGLAPIESILDLPCGTGRLWPMLRGRTRMLLAMDASPAMLRSAPRSRPAAALALAESIPLVDGAVDLVFCHRLMHHYRTSAERVPILRELARVARRAVVVSFWATGNWRARREAQKRRAGLVNRRSCIPPEKLAADLEAAGLIGERIHWKLRFWSPLAILVGRKDVERVEVGPGGFRRR